MKNVFSMLMLCLLLPPAHALVVAEVSGTEPVIVETTQSKEIVWDKIVNLLITNGASLKTVDKVSGIIQTGKIGLGSHSAAEGNKDGVWVVAENIGRRQFPEKFNGELTFYIKEDQGNTHISISLANLYAGTPSSARHRPEQVFTAYSTKELEKSIGAYLVGTTTSADFHFDSPEMATPIAQHQHRKGWSKAKRWIVGGLVVIAAVAGAAFLIERRGHDGMDGTKIR